MNLAALYIPLWNTSGTAELWKNEHYFSTSFSKLLVSDTQKSSSWWWLWWQAECKYVGIQVRREMKRPQSAASEAAWVMHLLLFVHCWRKKKNPPQVCLHLHRNSSSNLENWWTRQAPRRWRQGKNIVHFAALSRFICASVPVSDSNPVVSCLRGLTGTCHPAPDEISYRVMSWKKKLFPIPQLFFFPQIDSCWFFQR